MHIYQKLTSLVALAILSACAVPDWLGAGESTPKLEGERFEVMNIESKLREDESVQADSIVAPEPQAEVVGNNGNFALAGKLDDAKSVSIGEAPDEFFNISAEPVFADGKIFVVDGANMISALDTNLQTLWSTQIIGKGEDEEGQNIPAGIAYKNNRIFATTGFGTAAALDTGNGKILWQKALNAPMRNAPAVDSATDSNKIFISTADNKLFALSAETGEIVWRHSGLAETTRKFATASPVAKNNIVATAYASGEVFGLNAAQGREVWSEFLSGGQSQTKVAAGLNDVSATPLIVDGIIYATNAGGKLVAINFNNGARIWEQNISGVATPWVAGSYLFIINDRGNMVALNRFDGRVKWIKSLGAKGDDSADYDNEKRVKWQGPIMANGALIAHNNFGEMILVEPDTGNTILRKEIPEGVYTPAKVVNGKLYFISNDAQLIELK